MSSIFRNGGNHTGGAAEGIVFTALSLAGTYLFAAADHLRPCEFARLAHATLIGGSAP